MLHGYGEYPAKYRKYIWRQLLRLPENFEAYNSLLAKGTHSAYARLHERFPLRSRKILRIFQRNLSALAHWAPIFGEIEYLPELAFPIIKFYENSPFVSFEILVTFLTNWCQQWFDFFPNPPINVLSMVDNILVRVRFCVHLYKNTVPVYTHTCTLYILQDICICKCVLLFFA